MPPPLYDPPELSEDAAGVDPPMSAWPGAMRTPQDVMAACGTPATGSGVGAATGVSPVLECVVGRARLPFIPGMVVVVVVVTLLLL